MSSPIPGIVGEVLQELQKLQGQSLPPPATMPQSLLAEAEILGEDPGKRRPPGSGGPGAAIAAAWKTLAAAEQRATVFSGNGQIGKAATQAPVEVAVRITDAFGGPVPNSPVKFAVSAGGTGAKIEIPDPKTDKSGIAVAGKWTLGTAGINTVRATAASGQTVTFTAVAI